MAEKTKANVDYAQLVGHFRALLLPEKRAILLVAIYGLAVGVFSLVVPIAAQTLVNTVAFNTIFQPILVLSFVVLMMLATAAALRMIQTYIVENIQQRIFARVSLKLADRLPRAEIETYDHYRGTELVNRFFEVLTVQKVAALMLLDGLGIVLQTAIGLLLLAFYHPILLAFDAILVIVIFLVLTLPSKRAIESSIYESKMKYRVASWLEEIARNPVTFKFSGLHRFALHKADELTADYVKARKSHFRILAVQIAGTLGVQTVLSSVLLGLGSFLVIKKQLTLGQLIAAELVVTTILSGFSKFGKYLESFYDLTAAVDKLGHLLDIPVESLLNRADLDNAKPYSIELNKVNFRYQNQTTGVLESIDLHIHSGELLGIYGGNGTGKSTLLDLIVGLRSPTSGYISVNGIDLRNIALNSFRESVAIVRQAEIFDGTVLDNLVVGRKGISLEKVTSVLNSVGLHSEIASLQNGLQTSLTGALNPLSAGQTQKLMLARAVLGEPRLLVLDEALEGIDTNQKERILKFLTTPCVPWTLILATHDELEMSFCSKVVSIQDGALNYRKSQS